jgi:hypothetical protein
MLHCMCTVMIDKKIHCRNCLFNRIRDGPIFSDLDLLSTTYVRDEPHQWILSHKTTSILEK